MDHNQNPQSQNSRDHSKGPDVPRNEGRDNFRSKNNQRHHGQSSNSNHSVSNPQSGHSTHPGNSNGFPNQNRNSHRGPRQQNRQQSSATQNSSSSSQGGGSQRVENRENRANTGNPHYSSNQSQARSNNSGHRSRSNQLNQHQQHHRHPNPNQRGNNQQNNHVTQQRGIDSFDQILIQYDKLLFQHNEARKKYFEYYYRADYQRLSKLEEQFYRTGIELRKFEKSLKPHQWRDLKELKIDYFPEDKEYTTSHPEGEQGLVQIQFDEKNIHINQSQLARDTYQGDKEVTEGSFDDYLQYKKLTAK
jgi:hypothetical protein